MYQTSRELVIRAILEKKPDISATDLKKEIFLHFYQNDFNKDQTQKILDHLEKISRLDSEKATN
jgi:hypothetical protein